MIGIILGGVAGLGAIVSAWNGELVWAMLLVPIAAALIGLIFPMTMGMALTSFGIASILAAGAALISTEWGNALIAGALAVISFAASWIIALVRGAPA